ncbi:MAG: hypothetical protein J0G94_10095 [Sphingomonadales bacterium]|nr:hypothetical protein [Sphingomonadales bacterium]
MASDMRYAGAVENERETCALKIPSTDRSCTQPLTLSAAGAEHMRASLAVPMS